MDLVVSSISQGILWGVLSLGLFISFRILNIADMTTRGEPILSNASIYGCWSISWRSHSILDDGV